MGAVLAKNNPDKVVISLNITILLESENEACLPKLLDFW